MLPGATALAVLALDLVVGGGVGLGALHVVPVWLAFRRGHVSVLLSVSAACGLCVLIGGMGSLGGGAWPLVLADRGVALLAIGVVCLVSRRALLLGGPLSRQLERAERVAREFAVTREEDQRTTRALLSITEDLEREREKLRRSVQERARLASIVEGSPDAIISKTLDGVITSWNTGAEHLYGYTAGEVLGTPIERLVPEDRVEELRQVLERLRGGEVVRDFETVRRRKDGELRDVSMSVSLIRDDEGRPVVAATIARDITERLRLERELRALKDELEQRVQERTEELEQAVASLEESNAQLHQFSYAASHDLQAPLRGIAGFARLLQDDYQGKLGEEADGYIERIVQGCERLRNLIEDLLTYSRLESAAAPFQPTDLGALFDDVLASSGPGWELDALAVTRDELPVVHGDSTQLTQLLQNLIDNAVKYRGPDPPRIHVSAQRADDEWVISIKDNGIGIDPKFQARIFEVFRRLHTAREYPGTGIGLATCRRIVRRHQGRIWVESVPGEGSDFRFSLPAAP